MPTAYLCCQTLISVFFRQVACRRVRTNKYRRAKMERQTSPSRSTPSCSRCRSRKERSRDIAQSLAGGPTRKRSLILVTSISFNKKASKVDQSAFGSGSRKFGRTCETKVRMQQKPSPDTLLQDSNVCREEMRIPIDIVEYVGISKIPNLSLVFEADLSSRHP